MIRRIMIALTWLLSAILLTNGLLGFGGGPLPAAAAAPPTARPVFPATAGCPPGGQLVPSPSDPNYANALYAVAAPAPDDVWSVGSNGLILHWDGTTWTSQNGPGDYLDAFAGMAALAPNNIWVVGYRGDPHDSLTKTRILHWDGTAWAIIVSPNVGTYSTVNRLLAVSARAANDIWAVGYYSNVRDIGAGQVLTMHWDGTAWTIVPAVSPGSQDTVLDSVVALAPDNVWAVGQSTNAKPLQATPLIEHWDGTAWQVVPNPAPTAFTNNLTGIAARSAGDIWAVGTMISNGNFHTLILHYDGTAWSRVPGVQGNGDTVLTAVAIGAGAEVWAVGMVESPDPTVAGLFDMLVEHWDGAQWSLVPSAPRPAATSQDLKAMAVTGGGFWGVGISSTNTPQGTRGTTLVEHGAHFADVALTDYFYTPVATLVGRGILAGYSDCTFRPQLPTTRAQVTKILVRAAGWALDTTDGPHFRDVPVSDPFYAYIETAYQHGIVVGYTNQTFRSGTPVTRAQFSKMLTRTQGWALDTTGGPHFQDVPVTDPFYAFIETAYHHQVLSGYSDGTFRAGNSATRGQISKILYTALNNP